MSASAVANHIFNVDGNWGTSQFPVEALTEVVTRVHFCAHENMENAGFDGQPATNHWSLFLEIGSTRSVQVDVAPGDPHAPGMVIVEMKNYKVSNNNVHDVHSEVPDGTTVETIFGLIISKGRDRYMFTPVGEGCRYWLWTFAWDMVNAHLLPSEVAERASNALACYWRYPANNGYELRAMLKGKFF